MKILYITITILLFQFKPVLSGENYFYVLGSKPIETEFDWYNLGNTSPQTITEEFLTIGFGRDIKKSFIYSYDLAFELDYSTKFNSDDSDQFDRVPCRTNFTPNCKLEYQNLFNFKLLTSKTIENFKPQLILGISTAKIEGVVDTAANDGGNISNKRKYAPLVGLGLEYELSNGMSLKSEFTKRDFGILRKGVTKTSNLELNLFSIGLKKKF